MRSRNKRQRGRKNKKKQIIIIFDRYFAETWSRRLSRFKPRPDNLDLFNLRLLPFPILGLSVVADSAGSDFLLFVRICRRMGGCMYVVRLRLKGKRKKRNDGSPTRGPSPDHSFASQIIFFRRRFCGECRRTCDPSFLISADDFVRFPHLCALIVYAVRD